MNTTKITSEKAKNKNFIYAVGRRKESSSEVRLYTVSAVKWGEIGVEKGEIIVNKKKAADYFGKDKEIIYTEPFDLTGTKGKFAVTVKVAGGGKSGQLEATVLAIARGLDKIDREKFHTVLKKKGLLTQDSRVRERRKVGMGGKARRRKQSPKR